MNLKNLLSQIKKQATLYSSITIVNLNENEVTLKVDVALYNKEYTYKIKGSIGVESIKSQILQTIKIFDKKKLVLQKQNMKMYKCINLEYQEIILDQEIQQSEFLHISKIKTKKYTFHQIYNLQNFIKTYNCIFSHGFIQMQVNFKTQNASEVIDFIEYWITTSNKLECILIYINQQLIAKLENKLNFGLFLYFTKGSIIFSQKYIFHIIEKLFEKDQYFSCQFSVLVPYLMKVMCLIFEEYQNKKNYLFKFGDQLQITNYSLLLNTIGLEDKQVQSILKIMKRSGHYQFICYSRKRYFPEIVKLFMSKPFIRFNIYMYEENQGLELKKLAKKMQDQAENFRKKVLSFMKIYETLQNTKFDLVLKIFFMMSKMQKV